MRFAAVFLCFCAVAFSQSAPGNNLQQAVQLELLDKLNPPSQDLLKRRIESMKLDSLNPPSQDSLKRLIESMKLDGPKTLPGQTVVIGPDPARNSVCAIPLLNALPAQGKVDYKLRIVEPAPPGERTVTKRSEAGIPACK
jgi:hypothetical protein